MPAGRPRTARLPLLRRIFGTFRGRLALTYITVELSILLFAGVLIYWLVTYQVYREIDERIALQCRTLVDEMERTPIGRWPFHLDQFARHFPGTLQLVRSDGAVVFASDRQLLRHGGDRLPMALAEALRDETTTFVSTDSLLKKANMRVVSMPVHLGDRLYGVVMLGRSTQDVRTVMQWIYLLGGGLGLLSMVISGWVGYVMAGRAYAPLRQIVRTARAVAAGDLSRRLKPRGDDPEIRALEEALNRMFHELEASFSAQKRFTADASHELRIPLTILKGEVEVALRHPRSVEEYQAHLRQQLEMIGRMQRIVDDLLTLARADAGQLELVQEPVDLTLLLQEVGQHHLILFAREQISLEMDIAEGLRVNGDQRQLERVIYNLLNNAYKYAPRRSSIYLHARAEGRQVFIHVRDEGPGIAEEHLEKLFVRFFRADDSRARRHSEGGAGLGLAICKHIIQAHGGTIRAESAPGMGAEFIITLPRA
ncbi:MAG: HAMP domain-containing protein [Zetaproteobacteria bacterium]|nr:MAG: HAMP domain-containing protein [Zetaproteobacteria bacterium]